MKKSDKIENKFLTKILMAEWIIQNNNFDTILIR